ncbi:MAG: YeeE/YedE family protein, partial [Microbacteriaceae bacterium]|nr:YeeE/YedE family protein [Burkholderiaceae bacterium]
MTSFTPGSAALGGGLIGTAAVLLWWLNGRIAGVSGVAGGVLAPGPISGGRGWRLPFLLGLVLGTAAWFGLSQQLPAVRSGMHPGLQIAAGLLVGYGNTMAGGCNSGHGVCGLGRLSQRS